MIVTIFRHGEAGRAITDRLRELTGEGMDDVAYACHHFHDICQQRDIVHPDLVLHSPWVRTTQTADIIATAFTHAAQRPLAALQPGSDIAAVDTALGLLQGEQGSPQHVLLVSHQPLVSRLLDHYLGEPGRVPSLSPGGLATLALDEPAAACAQLLFWALPPEYEAGA